MPKQSINLIYCRESKGQGNFGDELSKFIAEKLIDNDKYILHFNKTNIDKNLICIGSYIHQAKNNCYIFGSGVRTANNIENGHKYSNLNVCAVRGPLTKKFLDERGIVTPNIFGDPALLLPNFYLPKIVIDLKDKIGVLPHKSNYKNYKDKIDASKFFLINPLDKWENVINYICSCKSIISSSLHGLICSDAYNIPNLWIDEFKLKEGDFKFRDYFLSQNRDYKKINNLSNYSDDKLYTKGNILDLDKLEKAFPFNSCLQ